VQHIKPFGNRGFEAVSRWIGDDLQASGICVSITMATIRAVLASRWFGIVRYAHDLSGQERQDQHRNGA
jgi:hypothetical protein